MITKVLEADILTERVVRFDLEKQRAETLLAAVFHVIGGAVLIAGFVGLFFAIRLGLEVGGQVIMHEIAEHVRCFGEV